MIAVLDSGCALHQPSHLTFVGGEAEVIEGILHYLPQTGGCLSYLCDHGYSHRISFNKDLFKFLRLPESASKRNFRWL